MCIDIECALNTEGLSAHYFAEYSIPNKLHLFLLKSLQKIHGCLVVPC